jgi:DNA polymerase-3 subunit epsilon
VWRLNPGIAIHPDAERTHGITAAQLEGCPTFAEMAPRIESQLRAASIIVGYNLRFDLDMLQAEIARVGLPPLDLSKVLLIDPLRLWQHFEPRTLAAAHERFAGAAIVDAHTARADVDATVRVLVGMFRAFGVDGTDWKAIAAKSDPLPERHSWAGPTDHLQWRNGKIVIAFGKHKGTPLLEADPSYLQWMIGKNFPKHVEEIVHSALVDNVDEFLSWARSRYPEPINVEPLAEAG